MNKNPTGASAESHSSSTNANPGGSSLTLPDESRTKAVAQPHLGSADTSAPSSEPIATKTNNNGVSVENFRGLADTLARGAQLTPGTSLQYHHSEVTEDSIRYIYSKVFDQPRKESPSSVTVIVDLKTQQARILLEE